jgi:hypothetical protein
VAIGADKCQYVAALCHVVFPLPTFVRLLGYIGESCFQSKKVAKNGEKTLRLLGAEERRPKTEETECYCCHCEECTEGKGSLLTPTRHCFASICCPGALCGTVRL